MAPWHIFCNFLKLNDIIRKTKYHLTTDVNIARFTVIVPFFKHHVGVGDFFHLQYYLFNWQT